MTDAGLLAEYVALRERLKAAIESRLVEAIENDLIGRVVQRDLRVLERHSASDDPDGANYCRQCSNDHLCCGVQLWECPEFADLVAVHLP